VSEVGGPTAPGPDADLAALVAGVRDDVRTAADLVDAIVTGVEAALAALPDAAAVAVVRDDVAAFRGGFDRARAGIEHALTDYGQPALLRAAGAVWIRDVCGPVSRLSGIATTNTAEVDDRWTGPAADAYRGTLPAQAAAFAAIGGLGGEVDGALNDLASALQTFWTRFGTAVVTLVVTLWGARVAAVTGVGAVGGLAAGATAVVVFVGAAAVMLNSLSDVVTTVATRAAAVDRRLAVDPAFPLGAWPRSTTAISTDAALRDGDDTDWHLVR
jgi:hypothetical protein